MIKRYVGSLVAAGIAAVALVGAVAPASAVTKEAMDSVYATMKPGESVSKSSDSMTPEELKEFFSEGEQELIAQGHIISVSFGIDENGAEWAASSISAPKRPALEL